MSRVASVPENIMKRGECRINEPPRIVRKPIDIESALAVTSSFSRIAGDVPPDRASVGGGRAKMVAFAPLFDPCTMLKVKESVQLRFRAREALSGVPIP